MGEILKLLQIFSTSKLVTENNLQKFEQLSHRGLWMKMLETWVFWVFILTLLTAFKKKVYFNHRLQKHRRVIFGFSTKKPRGENTFAPKCTLLILPILNDRLFFSVDQKELQYVFECHFEVDTPQMHLSWYFWIIQQQAILLFAFLHHCGFYSYFFA